MRKVQMDIARSDSNGHQREGKGIWVAEPISPPKIITSPTVGSPKVLVVANAKGGVGKTTVAANVAARFAELAAIHRLKPILLIDLDFQGTLSAMAIYGDDAWLPAHDRDSDAAYLISGDWNAERIANVGHAASSRGPLDNGVPTSVENPKLKIIRAHYDLAQAENREMIQWLIGDRTNDIRFRLKQLLWCDQVINSYSAVVIDCPPRFTTAAVQGLAAATHLLIPTKLDSPSADAVVSFARQVETLREAKICPDIQYVGVVATMVGGNQDVTAYRRRLNDRLRQSRNDGGVDGKTMCLDMSKDIPESVAFRDAGGGGIAYTVMAQSQRTVRVRSAINNLAHHVATKMVLPNELRGEASDELDADSRVA